MLINFPLIEKSHIYYVRMRNPKLLKTGPEFYKTQIFLEDSLLILTNIQTWDNYRLYSQDLANLVHENIGFHFKKVYQMFRFLTRFLPESRKFWWAFLILLCLILYGVNTQTEEIRAAAIAKNTDTVTCPDCQETIHRGSLRIHRERICNNSRL